MHRRFLAALALSGLLAGSASTIQTASISEAYRAYERGRFEKTLELIHRAENAHTVSDVQRAELVYLQAQAHEGLGHDEIAATLYAFIEAQHPDTRYAWLARAKREAAR